MREIDRPVDGPHLLCRLLSDPRMYNEHGTKNKQTNKQKNAMRYPKAHTVLEACVLEAKEFAPGTVDAVLVSKPDGACVRHVLCIDFSIFYLCK